MDDARRSGMDEASLLALRETLGEMTSAIETVDLGDQGKSFPVGYEGVWPDNVAIVEAFLSVATQWRVVTRGGGGVASPFGGSVAPLTTFFVGLDYGAVRAGLDAGGLNVTPELWRGLQLMENTACAVLNA